MYVYIRMYIYLYRMYTHKDLYTRMYIYLYRMYTHKDIYTRTYMYVYISYISLCVHMYLAGEQEECWGAIGVWKGAVHRRSELPASGKSQ